MQDKLKKSIRSPFFGAYILLIFVVATMPIIYFNTKLQHDIRQHAASIVGGSIAINTDEVSYKNAAAEVLPENSIMWIMLIALSVVACIGLYITIKIFNNSDNI